MLILVIYMLVAWFPPHTAPLLDYDEMIFYMICMLVIISVLVRLLKQNKPGFDPKRLKFSMCNEKTVKVRSGA